MTSGHRIETLEDVVAWLTARPRRGTLTPGISAAASQRLAQDLELDGSFLAVAERVDLRSAEVQFVRTAPGPRGADFEHQLRANAVSSGLAGWLKRRSLVEVGDFGGDALAIGTTRSDRPGSVSLLDFESSDDWILRPLSPDFETFLVALARIVSVAAEGGADLAAPGDTLDGLPLTPEMREAWAYACGLIGIGMETAARR